MNPFALLKRIQAWLPVATGVVTYLGVAPLRCEMPMCSGIVARNGSSHVTAAVFGASIGAGIWLIVLTARHWERLGRGGRATARVLLLLTTLLCLASMGGAMLGAFPILAPLIALMIRHSHPATGALWAILGLLAAAEAGWMYTYVFPQGVPLVLSMAMVAAGSLLMLSGIPVAVARRRMAPR